MSTVSLSKTSGGRGGSGEGEKDLYSASPEKFNLYTPALFDIAIPPD